MSQSYSRHGTKVDKTLLAPLNKALKTGIVEAQRVEELCKPIYEKVLADFNERFSRWQQHLQPHAAEMVLIHKQKIDEADGREREKQGIQKSQEELFFQQTSMRQYALQTGAGKHFLMLSRGKIPRAGTINSTINSTIDTVVRYC
jgi:hypothetical protein